MKKEILRENQLSALVINESWFSCALTDVGCRRLTPCNCYGNGTQRTNKAKQQQQQQQQRKKMRHKPKFWSERFNDDLMWFLESSLSRFKPCLVGSLCKNGIELLCVCAKPVRHVTYVLFFFLLSTLRNDEFEVKANKSNNTFATNNHLNGKSP